MPAHFDWLNKSIRCFGKRREFIFAGSSAHAGTSHCFQFAGIVVAREADQGSSAVTADSGIASATTAIGTSIRTHRCAS